MRASARSRSAITILGILFSLAVLGIILSPLHVKAQSGQTSAMMRIIAGVSVGQEAVTCSLNNVCTGTSTLGYIVVGCRGNPYNLPASPIPICNTGYGGDGGPAVVAMLNQPIAVAADAQGNVYVADAGNGVVRRIDTSGNISTYACVDATTGAVSYSGCQLPPSNFYLTPEGYPAPGVYTTGVAVDSQGKVHVGVYSVGNGQGGDLAMTSDPSGNVYRLYMGSGGGFDVAIYKNGNVLFSTQGGTLPSDTMFAGLAADAAGNLYTIESGGNIVRIDPSGNFSVVVSAAPLLLPIPGSLGDPLAIDSNGNLYVLTNFRAGGATLSEYSIATQQWTTVAGTGTNGFNNANSPSAEFTDLSNPTGGIDAPMPATSTDLNNANGIAIGPDGALYIADTGNNVVRKIGGKASGPGCNECGPTTLALTDQITRQLPNASALNTTLHKLYMITSAAPGVLTAFDTTNDTVIDNIQFGPTSVLGQLAVDSANNLVYVTDTANNAVYVINSNDDQQVSGSPVALPGAPGNIAVLSDQAKAYVTTSSNTGGGVSVISGATAKHLSDISLFVPSAIIADPQRDKVYVRFFGPANLGEEDYSLAVIDAKTDQVSTTASLGIQTFESTVYPDSLALNESTGDVMIADDFDKFMHLWEYANQSLSGFFGGFGGFFDFHVAADSINGIYYTWDGYGNVGYLIPNQSSGIITSTSVFGGNSNLTSVAVDSTTQQAYIANCGATNSDGTFGTLTLWDGDTDTVTASMPLEVPANATGEGCAGMLVDASNPTPTAHSAWLSYQYITNPAGLNVTTGELDVINGPAPAARPAITISPNPLSFGTVGIGQSSESQLLQITNSGQAPLTSLTPLVQNSQDPGSIQFTDCSGSLPLAPGASCDLFVSFTPSQLENLSATIEFLDNAPDTPQGVAVTGAGITPTGALTISPQSLPPGTLNVPYSQKFTASGSTQNQVIFTLGSGSLPPGLSLYPYGQISGTPSQIGTFTFTIDASDPNSGRTGSQLYAFTITETAGQQTVADIYGTGSSGTVPFGAIEVNEPSATQQINITDDYASSAALQITSIVLTGPNAGDFKESDNCGIATQQLEQPGISCAIDITFLPAVAPTANEFAELVIGSNAVIAPLSLTGTSAPQLGAPSSLPVLVSADNGNPSNAASTSSSGGCYPPECGSGSGGVGSVSSGGKFVAFSFPASNLPGPPLATSNFGSTPSGAYLRNTCVGAAAGSGCVESTQYIAFGPTLGTAPGSNGGQPCNNSIAGGTAGSSATAIDSTGEFVLFESDMCAFGGSNSINAHQIFLRDALYGNTALVSLDSTGTQVLDHGASESSMSSDARFFAFESASTNAVSGFSNPNGNTEVYWRDSCLSGGNQVGGCTPQSILVSQDAAADGANDLSEEPSISSTGRFVAYASYATQIPSTPANNDATGLEQIYLHDTCSGAPQGSNCAPRTRLISVDANGNAVGGTNPSVSSDGRFVAFISQAPTLVSVTNPPAFTSEQVYLADTCMSNGAQVPGCAAQPPILVSQAAGVPADAYNSAPSISADGSFVTFSTDASVLNPSAIYQTEVYKYTNCLAPSAPINCKSNLEVISVDSTGNQLLNVSGGGSLDPTGQYFVFVQANVAQGSYGSPPEVYLGATAAGISLKITQAIAWANPAPIAYGTALGSAQLDASTGIPGTFVYNPPLGTLLSAGSQTLSVTFIPTDTTDYNSATASVQITVSQAVPAIVWSTPAPIPAGTALSTVQLNATANVPGTFVYLPASGTIFATGTQTLSATFTPTDTTDYTAASATVTLIVNPVSAPPVQVTDNETIAVSDSETFPDVADSEPVVVTDSVTVTPLTLPPPIGVAAPVAEFSAGSLGFNSQNQGQQTLAISNIGQASTTLTLASVAISGPFSISQMNCFNGAASPGGTAASLPSAGFCTITVTYAGSSPTTDAGALVFTDNAALSNLNSLGSGSTYAQSITLTGSGTGTAPPPPPAAVIPVTDNETINVSDGETFPDVSDAEPITVTDTVNLKAITPVIKIGPPSFNPFTITVGSGTYMVVLTLTNNGNVPIDGLNLLKASLGGLGAIDFPAGTTLSNLAPGTSATFTATFSNSAGAPGKSVPMSFSGSYSAGSLSGNWTIGFRSVTLP